MRIIDKKDCYVQGIDIENMLVCKPNNMPYNIEMKLNSCMEERYSLDYYKIEDEDVKKYINSLDMPDYEALSMLKIGTLDKMILRIKMEMYDDDCYEYENGELESKLEEYKRKRNQEYIISQIREMIKIKKHNSTINYPMIINPYSNQINGGTLRAGHTLDYNKVIIKDLNGNPITENDIPFCKVAFKMLMHDEFGELNDEDIKLTFSDDGTFCLSEVIKVEDSRFVLNKRKK